jgi:hypothetical protein
MREKSGVSNGSVLGFAKGLDAGSVADALVAALRGAGAAAAVLATATAAVARRSFEIISLPKKLELWIRGSSTDLRLTQV